MLHASQNRRKLLIEFIPYNRNSAKMQQYCSIFPHDNEIYELCDTCHPVGIELYGVRACWFWRVDSNNIREDGASLTVIKSILVGNSDVDGDFPPEFRNGEKPVTYKLKLGGRMNYTSREISAIRLPGDILTEVVIHIKTGTYFPENLSI